MWLQRLVEARDRPEKAGQGGRQDTAGENTVLDLSIVILIVSGIFRGLNPDQPASRICHWLSIYIATSKWIRFTLNKTFLRILSVTEFIF